MMVECFNKPKFEAAYPGAGGIIILSKIGYNSDRTQALISTQQIDERIQGEIYVILLVHDAEGWKIEDKNTIEWII